MASNESFTFVGFSNGELTQFHRATFAKVKTHKFSAKLTTKLMRVACSPDNKYVFASLDNNDMCLLDGSTLKVIYHYEGLTKGGAMALCVSTDSAYLYTANLTGVLKSWGLQCVAEGKPGQLAMTQNLGRAKLGYYTVLATSPNGRYLFAGDSFGNIDQYCLKHNRKMATYDSIFKKAVTAAFVGAKNLHLYVASITGQLKRISIPDQILSQDFGAPHKAAVTSITESSDSTFLLTSDANGTVLQFDQTRFTSGQSTISTKHVGMVPLVVNYFNYTHNLNFLSSVILHKLCDKEIKDVREFLIENNHEVCIRYLNCNMYSEIDIIVMLLAYCLTGQQIRIPTFLKAINDNDKVARRDMNGLIYYFLVALAHQPDYLGERVVEAFHEYQFVKLRNFKRADLPLLRQKVVMTDCGVKDPGTEHLEKKLF